MSTVEIAKLTSKDHKNVLADTRTMFKQLGLDVLNFQQIYLDDYKREQTCYHLPYRETQILVTGYSVEHRAKVIDRWLELEQQNKSQRVLSPAEMLLQQAQQMVDIERKQLAQSRDIQQLQQQVTSITAKSDWVTIMGYWSLQHTRIGAKDSAKWGRRATAISKVLGSEYTPCKTKSEIFGEVNIYHPTVLNVVYDEYLHSVEIGENNDSIEPPKPIEVKKSKPKSKSNKKKEVSTVSNVDSLFE